MNQEKYTAKAVDQKTTLRMVSTHLLIEVDTMPGRPKLSAKDSPAIGKRLAELRKEQQLTQAELAERLKITQAAVSDYERGISSLNAPMLLRAAKTLGVSSDEILGLKTKNSKNKTKKLSRRILRRAEQIETLPARDQQALLRTIDAFITSQPK